MIGDQQKDSNNTQIDKGMIKQQIKIKDKSMIVKRGLMQE